MAASEFSRTEMLIGKTGMEKLRQSCILVFGAGDVIYGMTNIAKEKSLRSWSFRRAQCRQLPHYCDSPSKFKYI